jgi:hypothetical protein
MKKAYNIFPAFITPVFSSCKNKNQPHSTNTHYNQNNFVFKETHNGILRYPYSKKHYAINIQQNNYEHLNAQSGSYLQQENLQKIPLINTKTVMVINTRTFSAQ